MCEISIYISLGNYIGNGNGTKPYKVQLLGIGPCALLFSLFLEFGAIQFLFLPLRSSLNSRVGLS